jgi:hypothetical protein
MFFLTLSTSSVLSKNPLRSFEPKTFYGLPALEEIMYVIPIAIDDTMEALF